MERRTLQSIARRARALVVAAFVAAGLPAGARGQCPAWVPGFEQPDVRGTVLALATFDDGSGPALYAGGDFTSAGSSGASDIARWDGSAWSTVGGGTTQPGTVHALAVFDDGTGPALFAGGSFTSIDGVAAANVARWDGSAWTALGSGLDGACRTLVVFDDGTGPALYAGGQFTHAGGADALRTARWDGTSWWRLGFGMNAEVRTLAAYDDGSGGGARLYAGGSFQTADGAWVLGLASWDGTAWSGVGGGVSGVQSGVFRLLVHDDGAGPALFVAGNFSGVHGLIGPTIPASSVARWDGTSWSTLAGGCVVAPSLAPATVVELVAYDDGGGTRLHAGGNLTHAGGTPAARIASWDGAGWSALGAGVDGIVWSALAFDDGSGPSLFVGGSFTHAGAQETSGIARWRGGVWSPLSSGLPGPPDNSVFALAGHDDGSGSALYVGGAFTSTGATPAPRIARWRDGAWSTVGSGFTDPVNALIVHDDGTGRALYAGGNMDAAGAVAVNSIARWDGSTWSPLGTGLAHSNNDPRVYAMAELDDGTGPALYVGGMFQVAGGVPANNVARWDGASWSALGVGTSGSVIALAVHDDGGGPALYAAGDFANAGGVLVRRVARWDGTTWSALDTGFSGSAYTLAVYDDGAGKKLYAGGAFSASGTTPMSRIARWDGTSWSALQSGCNGAVLALRTFDDGNGPALFAGGIFTTAGGAPAARIARWNGGAWSALGDGLAGFSDPFVQTMLPWSDAPGRPSTLFVAGAFQTAGEVSSRFLARWETCQPAHATFCAGDGAGTACPCGNESAFGDEVGCKSSLGTGGRLRASGLASLANDTLLLSGSAMPDSSALYFQGTTRIGGGAGAVFGDGLRCAGGTILRLGTRTNVGGASQVPAAGGASVSALGAVGSPGVRTYQAWYRNAAAFCTPSGFNLTNGVEVAWTL